MDRVRNLIACMMLLMPSCFLAAQDVDDVIAKLEAFGCFEANVSFSVTLPQADDEISFDVSLASSPAPDDRLAGFSYLTQWTQPSNDSDNITASTGQDDPYAGFAAYFSGHHYRYRTERLQEYHFEWDSVPFLLNPGVQTTAQFTDLYPLTIARELKDMSDDTHYSLSLDHKKYAGHDALELKAVYLINGEVAKEKTFVFDATSMLPIRTDTENNPGAISEQTITVKYTYPSEMHCPELSEEALIRKFPIVFERFRESNFHIENLPGTILPTFSLPTLTGERYTFNRSEGFARPAVIAVLDADSGFNSEIIAQLRRAADSLPFDIDLLFVFTSSDIETVESIVGPSRPGEYVLLSGRSLVRDCGIASLPVIIMSESSGRVKKVELGFNKELGSIVLQTMALLR